MIFSLNKKIHQLHIKQYFITKNSFVAAVTFKISVLQIPTNHKTNCPCKIPGYNCDGVHF